MVSISRDRPVKPITRFGQPEHEQQCDQAANTSVYTANQRARSDSGISVQRSATGVAWIRSLSRSLVVASALDARDCRRHDVELLFDAVDDRVPWRNPGCLPSPSAWAPRPYCIEVCRPGYVVGTVRLSIAVAVVGDPDLTPASACQGLLVQPQHRTAQVVEL